MRQAPTPPPAAAEVAKKKVRPHCPECRSVIGQIDVQLGVPIQIAYCPQCGCSLGVIASSADTAWPDVT